MRELVYLMCAVTSLACTLLLFRAYVRRRTPLLLWSSLCFVGLTANSVLLFVDLVLVPDLVDSSILRAAVGAGSMAVLVVGLVWTTR